MKVTRYFQSCLLPDAVLYTHEHMDHFDLEMARKFAAGGADVYDNASTAKKMITIHYDFHGGNPDFFAATAEKKK